ncbi:hypothetical protein [Clostridium beijerinckii]|uniref:hypothetical protein n=1 Tax=Clostridium beijerinckii TaxID=1520 RepID=UPI001494E633|nr:hypothetical protein [Clostridium beijerinckii]NOW08052.1 hypothetical protein [Clostridium beijerinckii]NYC05672.1 hypothetical protein [Clostridium beijerinckii]
MIINELVEILNETGYPVFYSHFNVTDDNPAPEPPFMTYIYGPSAHMYADNKVYKEIYNIQIELYTKIKDLQAEKKLEDLFNSNEIPYSSEGEVFIETENIYQKIYEVRLT